MDQVGANRLLGSDIGAACFSFDWRQNHQLSSLMLTEFLRMAKDKGVQDLNIVAHSMGTNILLLTLGQTDEFDSMLNSMAFVAPTFGGVMDAITVLTTGEVAPAIDFLGLYRREKVKTFSATWPTMYVGLPAPPGLWVDTLPLSANGTGTPAIIKLRHPVHRNTGEAVDIHANMNIITDYTPDSISRAILVEEAVNVTRMISAYRRTVPKRLGDRIYCIFGLNGPTPVAYQQLAPDTWAIQTSSSLPGLLTNGDGVATLQSGFMSGLPRNRHLGLLPGLNTERSTHQRILEHDVVVDALRQLWHTRRIDTTLATSTSQAFEDKLLVYDQFIVDVDFSREAVL